MNLKSEKCIPCDSKTSPLPRAEAEALLKNLNNWQLAEDCKFISREYIFKNFKQALAFVNNVSEIAEAEKHHPDISFGWGYCRLKIQTHNINGLHKNDFILAAKIENIL